jgi:hypothetical protein
MFSFKMLTGNDEDNTTEEAQERGLESTVHSELDVPGLPEQWRSASVGLSPCNDLHCGESRLLIFVQP